MNWSDILKDEYSKPYYTELYNFVQNAYNDPQKVIYPPGDKIFNALELTPYDAVKCVIIGQDPYHGENQAMGLSFSVPDGVRTPPSLQNIYKELNSEFGYPIPNTGNLTKWATEGVLLLNAVLTVEAHKPASHQGKGWETYTDAIIKALNNKTTPVVFLLWGSFARSKKDLITNPNHLILEASHPSPFSANRGFFGCNHFKKCNEYLIQHGIQPIDWQIKQKGYVFTYEI